MSDLKEIVARAFELVGSNVKWSSDEQLAEIAITALRDAGALSNSDQLTALREENEALQERVKELEFDAFDEFDDCDDWSQKLRFSDHLRYRLGDFIHLIKNLHNLRRHKCRNCGNVEWTMHEFSPCFACTVEF